MPAADADAEHEKIDLPTGENVGLFRQKLKHKYDIEADEPLPDHAIELINRLHRLRRSRGRGRQ